MPGLGMSGWHIAICRTRNLWRSMKEATEGPSPLVETWDLNNRVNMRLIDALTDEQLGSVILPRGKAVTSYFAHIHMARYYWLERRARAFAKGLAPALLMPQRRHGINFHGAAGGDVAGSE